MFLRNVHRWVYICFGRFFARWSRLVQWIREVSGNDVHFCLFFSLSSLQLAVLSMLERVTEKWSHEWTRARRKRMPLPHCPRGITSHSLVPEKKTSVHIVYYYFIFSILGRRRFLLIGVSCMAVSVLALGIVAHYTSLGHAERKCHFTLHSSPTISQVSSTTTNSTSFSFVSLSSVNTTDPTPALASKGLRYFTLSALILFVGAYSFSFGPGELFYEPLITVNDATRLTIGE